ncbi:MAG TPA: MarR family transcriptional regulator [Verrucomicrobiaceae bacterium]
MPVPKRRATRPPSALNELPAFISRLHHAFPSFIDNLGRGGPLSGRMRPGMGSVLMALLEEDDCIVKTLVERLHLRNGTLTGLLDRLEDAGLVQRTPCPNDGRAFRVRLTTRGRELGPNLMQFHQRGTAALEAGLSRKDVADLKRLLARVLENIRSMTVRRRPVREAKRLAAAKLN